MSSRMDSRGTPKQRQDLEVWREAWEKEMEKLSPDGRRPFPDPRNFNVATQARKIIDLLEEHGIPCCVIGTKALCYYGAPRVCSVCPLPEPYFQLTSQMTDFRPRVLGAGILCAHRTTCRCQLRLLQRSGKGKLYGVERVPTRG